MSKMNFKKVGTLVTIALILTTILTTASSVTLSAFVQSLDERDSSVELIIGIKNAPNSYEELMELLMKYNGRIVKKISIQDQMRAVVVDIPLTMAESPFITEIKASGLSRYIEPNIRAKVFQFEPNDPAWNHTWWQWGPKKIKANWAWNITMGEPSVLVAVIDTGVDYNHKDLVANYVPYGYDWVNNDTDPMDDFNHGTHCAGIIAAEINNNEGIAGLAQVRIMAEKVGDSRGYAKFADVANGINHAVSQGAKIISMSFGHYIRSDTVYEAIKNAYDAGVLLVAAAGNENMTARLYPAAFDEVIAVTATDEQDKLWKDSIISIGSNYGNWVELSAPGKDIYSTIQGDTYTSYSGTSMATPHAAGVAALIWSRFPSLTRDQLRIHLRKTANDTGAPGFDRYFGYGRIDANASVSQPPPDHDVLVLDWKRPPYLEVGKPATIKPTVLNYGTSPESNITVRLLANGTIVNSTTISSFASGTKATVNLSWTPTVEGVYNITSHVVPVSGENIKNTRDNAVGTYVTTEVGILRVPKYYQTIQDAIDVANEGDTIRVANGNYTEVVNIYKHGLKFIGENKMRTRVTALNRAGWGFIAYTVNNIQISGFSVNCTTDALQDSFKPAGIYLFGSVNSLITNNIIEINNIGIIVSYGCKNVSIANNEISYNTLKGVTIEYTYWMPGNIVKNNLFEYNKEEGLLLYRALYVNITNNTFNHNGGTLYDANLLYISHHNLIKGNKFQNTFSGNGLSLIRANNNTIKENLFWHNKNGTALYTSNNNTIYHNTFNNSYQLFNTSSSNYWVGQWGTEGNYWDDYTGIDNYTPVCSKGIGDTNLPHLGVDYHPLMSPWFPGDANHDGIVNAIDLGLLGMSWFKKYGEPGFDAHVDFNEDGIVNAIDYGILTKWWFKTWHDYWGV